jgi:hypothetical protein
MTYKAKTRSQWMQVVQDNAETLRQLVSDWHPSARRPAVIQRESVLFTDGDAVALDVPRMVITAPEAELACQDVRQKIRQEEPDDPLTKWDRALAAEDIGAIMSLLSGAWFGIPESTECWSIPGFGLACDLMDDPPEEER